MIGFTSTSSNGVQFLKVLLVFMLSVIEADEVDHNNSHCPCINTCMISTENAIKREWCYVDGNNCALPFHGSANVSAIASNVYESTEACGNFDEYRFEQLRVDVSEGKTFRAVYPIDFETTRLELDDQLETSNRIYVDYNAPHNVYGSAVELMVGIFEKIQLDITYIPLSEVAIMQYPNNTFTACSYMVYLGLADICVGDFWVTTERLILSPMTTAFANDAFSLVVIERSSTTTFWKRLMTPFKPFEFDAWIGILLTTVYMAAFLYFVNAFTAGRNVTGESRMKKFRDACGNVAYGTIISAATGDATSTQMVPDEQRAEQMIAVAGYAFFGLITLTAYTASSAAFLVVENGRDATYDSVDAIFAAQKKICVIKGLIDVLEEKLNAYDNQLLGYDTVKEIDVALSDGTCAGAILSDLLSKYILRTKSINKDNCA
mmetsp:Transcript_18533/g.28822  ORF Transcript_18533/g.28822 Transcript_18533/m.28822 type:complete len:433 (-) Transcript_18533:436-1734(-)